MTTLIIIVTVFVALWCGVIVLTQKTLNRLDDVHVITTSLQRPELHELIVRALKGRNPMVRISRPDDESFTRHVRRGIGEMNVNVADIRIQMTEAEDQPGSWEVTGLIQNFRFHRVLGAGKTGAARAAIRRIEAVMTAIAAADPAAKRSIQDALVQRT